MLESGVIDNIWSKYRVKKAEAGNFLLNNCLTFLTIEFLLQGCLGNGLDALALDNLQGIFLILIGAYALAILLLIIECFIKYIQGVPKKWGSLCSLSSLSAVSLILSHTFGTQNTLSCSRGVAMFDIVFLRRFFSQK